MIIVGYCFNLQQFANQYVKHKPACDNIFKFKTNDNIDTTTILYKRKTNLMKFDEW